MSEKQRENVGCGAPTAPTLIFSRATPQHGTGDAWWARPKRAPPPRPPPQQERLSWALQQLHDARPGLPLDQFKIAYQRHFSVGSTLVWNDFRLLLDHHAVHVLTLPPPPLPRGGPTCPHCSAQGGARDGHKAGKQTYRCKRCSRTWTAQGPIQLLCLRQPDAAGEGAAPPLQEPANAPPVVPLDEDEDEDDDAPQSLPEGFSLSSGARRRYGPRTTVRFVMRRLYEERNGQPVPFMEILAACRAKAPDIGDNEFQRSLHAGAERDGGEFLPHPVDHWVLNPAWDRPASRAKIDCTTCGRRHNPLHTCTTPKRPTHA